MKKRILSCCLAVSMAFMSAACGTKPVRQTVEQDRLLGYMDDTFAPDENSGTNEEISDKYIMRVGHAQTTASPRHRSLEIFKEAVETRTNGDVLVEIYPNGELGDETAMTVAVSEGELEAVRGGDLEFVPKVTMLGLPMIADDIEQARKLCYSDFVADMLKDVETEHNMKVLAVGDDSGFRQITNNVHPIRSPQDMNGLHMRTVLEVIDISMQEYGASTVSIPFTELYDALANGTVDGQENPLALIDTSRFYEVQKYCTIINYMFFPELMYVNLSWWDSLPVDYRTIISECAAEMMAECGRITDEENEQYKQHIQQNGCEIYELTTEERAKFEVLSRRVWQKYIDDGRITRDELSRMLAVIGKSLE